MIGMMCNCHYVVKIQKEAVDGKGELFGSLLAAAGQAACGYIAG